MSILTFLSMLSFSLVMSISPGPVNILIISSGATNGFKKTFSFISGATIGFTLLLALVSLGMDKLINESFLKVIEYFGLLFIIYMGYKIASSNNKLDLTKSNKKLKFYEGFLLQWLNPKAWLASISGVSMFSYNDNYLIVFVFIYFIVCYLSLSFWGLLGDKGAVFLNTNKRLDIFNLLMGVVLIVLALVLISIKN